LEIHDSVDHGRGAVLQFVADHADLLRRQGSVQASWRPGAGGRRGPYFRLVFRRAGRQEALYLGADRALADEVRALLLTLRAGRRRAREFERQLALARAALRQQRHALDQELLGRGLYRKGSEVRGWRGPPRADGAGATGGADHGD